jgi:hypothetical protein
MFSYHCYVIRKFLLKYNCDNGLYDAIFTAKSNARRNGIGVECIRVEASLKNGASGRYTIPILLTEFKRYTKEDITNILSTVHMSYIQYLEFIDDVNVIPNTDIIFGLDGTKGKMYLDYGAAVMVSKCLESDGKEKRYRQVSSNKQYKIIDVYTEGRRCGEHYYLRSPIKIAGIDEYVYWIGYTESGVTYYFRPYLPLLVPLDMFMLFT